MSNLIQKITSVFDDSWRLKTEWGWRFEWTNGTETVIVQWLDGAGPYSGWHVEAVRPEHPTLQLTNGFVSFTEALFIADAYMGEDAIAPTLEQEKWVADRIDSDTLSVIEPYDLNPNRPRKATS